MQAVTVPIPGGIGADNQIAFSLEIVMKNNYVLGIVWDLQK